MQVHDYHQHLMDDIAMDPGVWGLCMDTIGPRGIQWARGICPCCGERMDHKMAICPYCENAIE